MFFFWGESCSSLVFGDGRNRPDSSGSFALRTRLLCFFCLPPRSGTCSSLRSVSAVATRSPFAARSKRDGVCRRATEDESKEADLHTGFEDFKARRFWVRTKKERRPVGRRFLSWIFRRKHLINGELLGAFVRGPPDTYAGGGAQLHWRLHEALGGRRLRHRGQFGRPHQAGCQRGSERGGMKGQMGWGVACNLVAAATFHGSEWCRSRVGLLRPGALWVL